MASRGSSPSVSACGWLAPSARVERGPCPVSRTRRTGRPGSNSGPDVASAERQARHGVARGVEDPDVRFPPRRLATRSACRPGTGTDARIEAWRWPAALPACPVGSTHCSVTGGGDLAAGPAVDQGAGSGNVELTAPCSASYRRHRPGCARPSRASPASPGQTGSRTACPVGVDQIAGPGRRRQIPGG